MIIINILFGNIFDLMQTGDTICCTTNSCTHTKDGTAVMGAGVAKAFKDKFKGIDKTLGEYLIKYGNRCFVLGKTNIVTLVSFPTKDNWQENSKLDLIEKSTKELVAMANKFKWSRILLPAPGCNNGGLKWENVKPILEKYLDDRFYIVFLNKPKDIVVGKVKLASVNSIKTMTDLDDYKFKLLIVRSSEKAMWALDKFKLQHAPSLSPSTKLFYEYLDMRDDNPNWFNIYEPKFMEEMKTNEFKLAYNRIKDYLNNGENVLLVCFCKDFNTCHRSIIGKAFEKEQYEVIWG